MRILVITSDPRWISAVRTAFSSEHDVIPGDPRQLGALRAMIPVVEACFVAENDTGAFTIDVLKQLSTTADAPLFAVADSIRPEWEEAALMAGARQVFRAPLRAGIVQLAVARTQRAAAPVVRTAAPTNGTVSTPGNGRESRELGLLRQFSRLLVYSVRDPNFLAAYLGHVREVLGCGRLLLYLRDTEGDTGSFKLAMATGVDPRQFENFRVYFDQGLGRLMAARGGAFTRERLRSDDPHEGMALREMTLFGAEIAVPVSAGQGCTGMLLIGSRISGGGYSDHEITLVYHLMEEFAHAVTQAAPAVQVARERPLFPHVLHGLPVGCAILDTSLHILDANDAFRSQLGRATANPLGIERLPAAWSDAINTVIQKRGAASQIELDHQLSGVTRRIRVTLQAFQAENAPAGLSLMVTEDITNETRLRQEIHERSVHNVLQRAGEQLSNEFRNALTPIEILVQLSGDSANARRDIERLRAPVSQAIHRLRRRVDNLGYLTKNSIVAEVTTVSAVFRAARERLDNWLDAKQLKTLVWSGEFSKVSFTADCNAVGLAVAELVMNAVEAAGGRQVTITAEDLPDAVNFKIRNPGEWAPLSESSGFGHRPFVTAKSAGVGLGVEVASRVAEYHGGRLVLGPVSTDTVEGVLRLPRTLPVVPTSFETPVAKVW